MKTENKILRSALRVKKTLKGHYDYLRLQRAEICGKYLNPNGFNLNIRKRRVAKIVR